jgi:predicted DNA-binding protein
MSGTVPLTRVSASELTEVVSVRLTADDVRRLSVLAQREERSVSTLIRIAIELLIEERLG